GERLGALLAARGLTGAEQTAALKLAAAITLLQPAVPMLFAGEEWGASTPFCYFTDHGEPELADAVREGRRAEFAAFGWKPEEIPDPQGEGAFLASGVDWSERRRPPHTELLEWHRQLIALRRSEPDLLNPDARSTRAEVTSDGALILHRGRFTIAADIT